MGEKKNLSWSKYTLNTNCWLQLICKKWGFSMAFIVKSTFNCNLKNPSPLLKLVIKMPLKPLQKDSRNVRLPIFFIFFFFKKWALYLRSLPSWGVSEEKLSFLNFFFFPPSSLWMSCPRFPQCHLAAGNSLSCLLPTLPESDPFWEAAFGIHSAHPTTSSWSFKQGIN